MDNLPQLKARCVTTRKLADMYPNSKAAQIQYAEAKIEMTIAECKIFRGLNQ